MTDLDKEVEFYRRLAQRRAGQSIYAEKQEISDIVLGSELPVANNKDFDAWNELSREYFVDNLYMRDALNDWQRFRGDIARRLCTLSTEQTPQFLHYVISKVELHNAISRDLVDKEEKEKLPLIPQEAIPNVPDLIEFDNNPDYEILRNNTSYQRWRHLQRFANLAIAGGFVLGGLAGFAGGAIGAGELSHNIGVPDYVTYIASSLGGIIGSVVGALTLGGTGYLLENILNNKRKKVKSKIRSKLQERFDVGVKEFRDKYWRDLTTSVPSVLNSY